MKLLCILALTLGTDAGQVTPINKVLQMLKGMIEKGKKEKDAEQLSFATEKAFCENTSANTKNSIEDSKSTIDTLTAAVKKNEADVAELVRDIAAVDKDVATWTGDRKAASSVRALDKADYDKLHKDYTESVTAIAGAINVLKKQSGDKKQAAFVELAALTDLHLMPEHAKKQITYFLQVGASEEGAPKANAYESQSGGVIDMLKKLQEKFMGERNKLEKEEVSSASAFAMLSADLSRQIKQGTKSRTQDSKASSKAAQKKAENNGLLNDEQKQLKADSESLSVLTATCEQKASDYESRQTLRGEEITAIQKAVEIISGGAVAGNGEKHLPQFLETGEQSEAPVAAPTNAASSNAGEGGIDDLANLLAGGTSFAGLRASTSNMQARVATLLKEKAKKVNSQVLATVAAHAAADPMKKVKKMIKGLVVRLMEEANEEAGHKGFCDQELGTNAQTRKEKTEAIKELQAGIDGLEASISKLSEKVVTLSKSVGDLDKAMAEATSIRVDEKAKNKETIEDAAEGQTAVAQAIAVLRQFYAKAAEATALVQKDPSSLLEESDSETDIMESDGAAPFQGSSSSSGVLSMLDVILSDFARLEADTKGAEHTASKTYEKFMSESKIDKAGKRSEMENKISKKQDATSTMTVSKSDLSGNQKELDAALAYYDKLKPTCVDSGVSYEERVSRRKAEIESLQDALKILSGDD